MLSAPVLARLGKPSIMSREVSFAIKRAPPMLFNDGMEMFVREGSPTIARSPPTEVRLGAIIDSTDEL